MQMSLATMLFTPFVTFYRWSGLD